MNSREYPRSPEYYRQRAEDMRKEATRAEHDDLRTLYGEMAKRWDALADKAERALKPE